MPTAKKEQVCEWFVRHHNAETNEIIALRLIQLQAIDEAMARITVKRPDGIIKKYDVWRVPEYSFITELNNAKPSNPNLKFTAYRQYQGRELAELWKFSGKKKSVKIKKVEKDIEALKKKA